MRTLLVSSSPQSSITGKVRRLLISYPGISEPELASFDSAETKCARTGAGLIVLLLDESPGQGQEVIRRLREKNQGYIVAVGEISDAKAILRSLQVGANLFLDVAELETEFHAALHRLFNKPEGGGMAGQLLGVVSASGGCGTSTVAVNLAAVLAREHKKCGLLDLNLGWGDLAALLDLRPQFSLADACSNDHRLDHAMLGKMVVQHSSGIHLLGSSVAFTNSPNVTASGVKHVLSLMRDLYPATVVDLEDCFHAEQVEVLRQVTGLLVVCRLDFTSLRNTRRLLDRCAQLELQRNLVRVVVNHYGQPCELPVDEAEDALGEKLTAFIPHDPKAINAANNAGTPLVVSDPHAKAAKSLIELANIDFTQPIARTRLLPDFKHLLKKVFNAAHGTA
jgi:pilus assembly protein CpaE